MREFPFPYRRADIAATFQDVIVARDSMNAFGGYAVLVRENDGWHVYADGLDYADAIGTAGNCAECFRRTGSFEE